MIIVVMRVIVYIFINSVLLGGIHIEFKIFLNILWNALRETHIREF